MKCPYCGAEVKKGQTICAYCDSEVVTEKKPAGQAAPSGRRGNEAVKIAAIVTGALFLLALIPVMAALLYTGRLVEREMDSVSSRRHIPREATGLKAMVEGGEDGRLNLLYSGSQYEGVRILDEELVEWLDDTGRSLTGVEILFDTDKNGNIKKMAMISGMFIVLSEEGGVYTACRGQDIIRFTSEEALETGVPYTGYFSYPKLHLASAEPEIVFNAYVLDAKCDEKRRVTEREAYTEEEAEVCQICSGGEWYYCSQEIYDALQEGDPLEDYDMNGTPPCLIRR